jgi:hypothetical protein
MTEHDKLMAALTCLADVVHAEAKATRTCVVVVALVVLVCCWWLS